MQVCVDAFTASECLPAAQAVHAIDPVLVLYLPATHAVQSLPVPVQPALQTHDVILALPVIECAFTHSLHSDLSSAKYDPAAQKSQLTADIVE